MEPSPSPRPGAVLRSRPVASTAGEEPGPGPAGSVHQDVAALRTAASGQRGLRVWVWPPEGPGSQKAD